MIKHCPQCGLPGSITHKLHLRSVGHRQGPRIRALLEKDCLSFTEIGDRLRVTRERVRQLSGMMGFSTGHVRQYVCRIKTTKVPESWEVHLEEFTSHGLTMEPITLIRSDKSFYTLRSEVFVNSHRCFLGHIGEAIINGRFYHHLSPTKRRNVDYEFYLSKLRSGNWMVIPGPEMPRKGGTYVVLERDLKVTGNPNKKDWRQYLNAWELIGGHR